jgi:hypothetical protein
VTVDKRVTATTFKLAVSMATVGIIIPFVGEENAVVVVVILAALDMVKVGMELEVMDDDVVDVVSMELESGEDVDDKI